jgi:catechol 2,3-dioxygenase-like lactoylglutathione lyase family enzyme
VIVAISVVLNSSGVQYPTRMRPHLVVVAPPFLDCDGRLAPVPKPLQTEMLVAEFTVERFVEDHRQAPVNALGYLRVMFAVDDIDDTLERLRERGAQLVGDVVRHKDAYRLCYIRGPEGLLIGLAQELS